VLRVAKFFIFYVYLYAHKYGGKMNSTKSIVRFNIFPKWDRETILRGTLFAIFLSTAAAVGAAQLKTEPATALNIDAQEAAEHLAGAVRIKTITYDDQSDTSKTPFLALHDYLAKQFPQAHKVMRREIVNGYSLLYTWPGTDPTAKPILLLAHQDVVPVAPGTEKAWKHDPFAGLIQNGFVWGRGAWDNKGNLCAMMQAVELLAKNGFRPARTIYFAFGHDEEAGVHAGQLGAKKIAELLKSRGVDVEFALDEGLLVTQGMADGVTKPVALIGVAEKGYLTLSLTSHATPGHSSMPSSRSAIGALSGALVRLENNPMPPTMTSVTKEMLSVLAPETHGLNGVAMSNLWLFSPIVLGKLEKKPSTNALLRTTTALTVIRGGNKEQVLPGEAQALVNFRLLPGDSAQDVIAHTRTAIADTTIDVVPSGPSWEASPISSTDSPSYRAIANAIRDVFPGTIVAPGLMVGSTDSHHMTDIADNIYRFSPVRARGEDLERFHGTNERISITNYMEMIRFYTELLANSAGATHS
jgi:carboxypeptidase PM20D1